jgi:hypothetical protein
MNAREVGGSVSDYERRERWRRGSVMWSTRDLGRQKVGGRSVMEVSGKRAQLLQAHGVHSRLF